MSTHRARIVKVTAENKDSVMLRALDCVIRPVIQSVMRVVRPPVGTVAGTPVYLSAQTSVPAVPHCVIAAVKLNVKMP